MLTTKRPPKRTRQEACAALVAAARPTQAVMATPASFTARVKPSQHKPEPAKMRPVTTTAKERTHMGRVAALGCVICRLLGDGPTPAQVHHIRTGQGAAQRAGDYLTVPLCEMHHTGPTGIHGDRSALRLLRVTELDLLDITIGELT
jgi:Recombination enhancement, RecA-dependent nuclease